MVRLRVLSGRQAGAEFQARRLPVRIGRAPDSDLALDDEGVWARHAQIGLRRAEGFCVTAQDGALTILNGQQVEQAPLRNGDILELGACRMAFGLTPTRHRSLVWRETLTWLALAALCLSQVALIYGLE